MCSDTAWSIPCCVVLSASISVEGPLSAAVAPFWELEDDSTEGRSGERRVIKSKEKASVHSTPYYVV